MCFRPLVLITTVAALLAAPGGLAASGEETGSSAVLSAAVPTDKLGAASAIFPGSVLRNDSTSSRSFVTLVGGTATIGNRTTVVTVIPE